VADQLPTESRFELTVPAGAMLGLNDRAARSIQDALVNWILATTAALPTARPGRYIWPIQKVTLSGVLFAVSQHRWPREEFPYPFVIEHSVEGDAEARRLARLREAYDRKAPKLQQWRANGARTVSILEEDDIFLTNQFNVADVLAQVEASSRNRPDEVYLLSVFTSMWLVTRLRQDDQTLYDLPVNERFWETHPSALTNVTGERRPVREPVAP
jgi:hypothetical protein